MPDDAHRAIHTAVQRILPRERTALGEYASILGATSRRNARFDTNIRKRERFQIVNEARAFCVSGAPQAMIDNRECENLVDAVKKYRLVLSVQTAICDALYIAFTTNPTGMPREELRTQFIKHARLLYDAGFGEEMVSVMKPAMIHGISLDETLADANIPKIAVNPAPGREDVDGVIFDAHPKRTQEETKSDYQKQIMDLCRASCSIMCMLYGTRLLPDELLFSDKQRDFNSKFVDALSKAMRVWRSGANSIITHEEYKRDTMIGYNAVETAQNFINSSRLHRTPLSEFISAALVLCKRISCGESHGQETYAMHARCCKIIKSSQDYNLFDDVMGYHPVDENEVREYSFVYNRFMGILIGVACDPQLNSACHFHARDAIGRMRSPDKRKVPLPTAIKQSIDQVLRKIAFINKNKNTPKFEVDVDELHVDDVWYVLIQLTEHLLHTRASDEKRHTYLPVVTYCVQFLLCTAQEDDIWRRHACYPGNFTNILAERSMVYNLYVDDKTARTLVAHIAAYWSRSRACFSHELTELCATFMATVPSY